MPNKIVKSIVEKHFLNAVIKTIDKKIAEIFIKIFFRNKPIKNNKIVFMTYNNGYICNPKYIAEEIMRQKLPWDLVWLSDKESSFPIGIRTVLRGTYQAVLEATTAHIWIDNSINFPYEGLPKNKKQVYFETWHGSLGIKRAGKDDVKNKYWVKNAKRCGRLVDYCISNSTFENNVYRETYWKKAEILLYGHARNDCLFNKDETKKIKEKIYKHYKIPSDYSLILYAPTWRDTGVVDCYNLDFDKLSEDLERKFGCKWKILIRLHFHDRNNKRKGLPECIVDCTDYPDMQELMMASAAGITDYSSWAFDFVLTRKPLFIYAVDLKQYNTERGLYYPLETTPFPIASNQEELSSSIQTFDDSQYQKKINDFLTRMGCVEDGHASERIVEKLKEIIGNY